jgi:hypothetical protein
MKHTRHPQCGTSRDIESPFLPPITLVVVLILVFLGGLAGYPPSETAALLTVTATVWWFLATNAAPSRYHPLA